MTRESGLLGAWGAKTGNAARATPAVFPRSHPLRLPWNVPGVACERAAGGRGSNAAKPPSCKDSRVKGLEEPAVAVPLAFLPPSQNTASLLP